MAGIATEGHPIIISFCKGESGALTPREIDQLGRMRGTGCGKVWWAQHVLSGATLDAVAGRTI